MNTVIFPASAGGATYTDDADMSTGLAGGGHRTRFVPALAAVVALSADMVAKYNIVVDDSANSAMDRTQTGLDKTGTGQDKTATAADKTQTGQDRIQTGLDKTATATDRIQTAADRAQTGQDKTATAADRAQTGQDKTATAADRIQTAQDRTQTGQDRVQTGLDKTATAADKTQTGQDRIQTGLDKTATAADKTQTGQDRVQTGLDKTATAADRIQTAADRVQTGLDKTAANASSLSAATDAATATLKAASASASAVDAAAQAGIVAASAALVLPAKINSIGTAGGAGFGVGICPALPAGFVALPGANDPAHANYGNYLFQDGSVMCWIPKYWYRIANAANATYGVYGVNSVDIRGLETYSSTPQANAAGYALHRMFVDGGVEKTGCFVDKFMCSQNVWGTGFIASSIANGNPISTNFDHNTISNLQAVRTAHPATKAITAATKASPCALTITGHGYVTGQQITISAIVGMVELNGAITNVTVVDANTVTLDGINSTAYTTYASGGTATAGTNAYYAAVTAAKARDGVNGAVNASSMFFCTSRFITAGLALLSLAHGQASSATTWCAWYSSGATNFPKGCNNNALRDCNDAGVGYTSDGYSNCGKTGSGVPFAKTTHNGQGCGVADLNGLMYEINPGLTCITTIKNITGITQANPAVATSVAHGLTNGQLILITNVVGMTQVNTCIHTVANATADTFELSGVNSTGYTAYASAGTITSGTFYVLKTAAAMKSMTPGNTIATDLWGATGAAANYDAITMPFANGACGKYLGNAANQVLSEATAGDPWKLAGLGFPKDANGVSAAGSSLFGNDYFYEYFVNDMVPISCMYWSHYSNAGVWGVNLGSNRTLANYSVGFRCACYPA